MTSRRSRRIRDKLVQAETVDASKCETVFLYFPLVEFSIMYGMDSWVDL